MNELTYADRKLLLKGRNYFTSIAEYIETLRGNSVERIVALVFCSSKLVFSNDIENARTFVNSYLEG